MRRSLARKTNQIAAEVATPRHKRTTAQPYVEGITIDEAPINKNQVNRFMTGVFLAAAATLAMVIISGLA